MGSLGFNDIKALVIDDFDNFRISLIRMLQEAGLEHVDSATNGKDALRKCRVTRYDLILCDYNLGGGKTGQQVLEEVRVNGLLNESSLYVMISAESSKPIVMAAFDFEPDAYLTKPITTKTLAQRLERLIRQRQQMAPIYRALDERDIAKAIEACKVFLSGNGRYRHHCQKLLGRLLLENGNYAEAEAVYREVLDGRDLDWAQVGMAIARRGQDDWVGAEQWAEQALKHSPLCMKAYDLQVQLQEDREDSHRQQQILQQAVEKSPRSIRRQQQLGNVAFANRDVMVAVNAFRRAVRLGEHSCYDDPDIHLNFIRAAAASAGGDSDYSYMRDVLKVMSDFEGRFGADPLNKVAVQSAGAVFKSATGDTAGAQKSLFTARSMTEECELKPPLVIEVDWLDCYDNLDEHDEYHKLLTQMQERYRKDQSALEVLDRMLDMPVSEKNRRWLAQANRQGIKEYEAKKYDKAIECFLQLTRKFPKHISVRLNLLQAYIGKLRERIDQDFIDKAHQLDEEIAQDIHADDDSYERYRQLKMTLLEVIKDSEGKLRE